jgi:hypothetical protein
LGDDLPTGVFPRRPGVGVGGFEKGNLRLPVGLWISPYKVVDQHKLVGQFRPADGLALLSGGTLGPQMFRRSHQTRAVEWCHAQFWRP